VQQGRRAPRWWAEVLLVAVFYGAYDSVRGLIHGDADEAIRHGAALLRLERLFAIGIEHPLNNHLENLAVLAVPACFFYASAHFLVTPAVMLWAFRFHPHRYRTARTVLAVLTAAALLGFWLYPTAPPRLLPGAGFHDTLAAYSGWGWWSKSDSAPRALASLANQFAAMPSLHVAWAMWCGVTVFRYAKNWTLRAVAGAYPVVTGLVVLGTANHYLLDVVAGVAMWWVADVAVRCWAARRPIRLAD
jgi:hypothetical protein